MVKSVNSGGGLQGPSLSGVPDKGLAADALQKASSLSQLSVTIGETRNIPVRVGILGSKTAEFMHTLSLNIDAFSPGKAQDETAAVGARLRLDALDRTPLSRDEIKKLDAILSSITGRSTR